MELGWCIYFEDAALPIPFRKYPMTEMDVSSVVSNMLDSMVSTTIPVTHANQGVEAYFLAHEDHIREVIQDAVSRYR
jgi:hypothetical protein